MANPVVSWAQDNPVAAGAAALGVVVVVMLFMGGSGSGEDQGASGGLGSAGVQAYYAAVAQQGQAGAAIQIAQISANADTNKALIAANYGIENSKIWAPVSLAGVQANAANESKQLDYNRELAIHSINTQHAMYDNYVNLENAKLAQQQNIAFKQINAQKKSVFDKILGAATTIIPAIATGGTSLGIQGIGSILGGGGSTAVSLPSLGSPGQWV